MKTSTSGQRPAMVVARLHLQQVGRAIAQVNHGTGDSLVDSRVNMTQTDGAPRRPPEWQTARCSCGDKTSVSIYCNTTIPRYRGP
jgi:hypothetical protein